MATMSKVKRTRADMADEGGLLIAPFELARGGQ